MDIKSLDKEDILRFSTAGSVDDGKSTFIGRLLYDTGNIFSDHLETLLAKSELLDPKSKKIAFAILTDGLQAEQEQGITIDIAYRYFSSPKRRFILLDSPGHERYTRNMATAASNADATVILVDAAKGISEQTCRHACIASLLGVPRIVVAINKMDLVDYQESVFNKLAQDFLKFSDNLQFKSVEVIPISAINGDNIVTPSKQMDWYKGLTVLEYLEAIHLKADKNNIDARFPVQTVIRASGTERLYGGMVASGKFSVGDEIIILPSGEKTRIISLETPNSDFSTRYHKQAKPGEVVNMRLSDQRDISRGDMIARPNNRPEVLSDFEAMLIWFDEEDLLLNREYVLRHTTKETKGLIRKLHYALDINTLHKKIVTGLKINEIGRCSIELARPIYADSYDKCRDTGSFILVDSLSNKTVAAGLIINRISESDRRDMQINERGHLADNIEKSLGQISREDREKKIGHSSKTFWFTGLSGSGKSTLSSAFEVELYNSGRLVYRLDGDNLRHGLNRNLGFSDKDRAENIRRTAEVAKILNEAGVTVLCSLISPFQKDRQIAKEIVGQESFVEIYVSTPLEVCEQRDVKGLYAKARRGEIPGFTGISAPYEESENPDYKIDTSKISLEEAIQILRSFYDSNLN